MPSRRDGQPLMGSGRGRDLADDDEEYGSTPRRDICDYFGAEGCYSGEQSTSGTDTGAAERQFFMGR